MNTKTNPRFVGLIMALLLPGAAHAFSGHWKTGIVWFCICYLDLYLLYLCPFIVALPVTLFLAAVIAALSMVIITILLLISSYRPTRLGREGWFYFLCFAFTINTVNGMAHTFFMRAIENSTNIYGISMYPTIKTRSSGVLPLDAVVINRQTYRSSDPCRGDIVGFVSENDERVWIKRIVGLPGEAVDFQHPYVLINGKRLLEPPIFAEISLHEREYDDYNDANEVGLRRITLPITLGSDEYLLFGDNTSMSWDKRMYGPVSREEIVGQVTWIIFPPWRIQELTTFGSGNENDASEPLDNLSPEE